MKIPSAQILVSKQNSSIQGISLKECLICGLGQEKHKDEPGTSCVSESKEVLKIYMRFVERTQEATSLKDLLIAKAGMR